MCTSPFLFEELEFSFESITLGQAIPLIKAYGKDSTLPSSKGLSVMEPYQPDGLQS